MKLIKINTNHYVVVDDSKIDYDNEPYLLIKDDYETYIHKHKGDNKPITEHYKITHSTQPLETSNEVWEDSFKRYDYITLQEIKELLGKVDIEKKIYALCQTECIVDSYGKATDDGMVIGIRAYNQALEDNKEKKYTEKELIWAIQEAYGHGQDDEFDGVNKIEESIKTIIEFLQAKTQWEVEIVDGKLKLI